MLELEQQEQAAAMAAQAEAMAARKLRKTSWISKNEKNMELKRDIPQVHRRKSGNRSTNDPYMAEGGERKWLS